MSENKCDCKSSIILRRVGKSLWETQNRVCTMFAGHTITVPEGFVTDLASVPRPFWNILPPFGHYDRAAIIHDYLYGSKGEIGSIKLTRAQCDEIFRSEMIADGVSGLVANIMWAAVRLNPFNWPLFKKW